MVDGMSEVLSNGEMAQADRLTIEAGVDGIVLMENAGRAVAELAASLMPAGKRVVILAGPGNNGGDGFVAARLLAERGYKVRVLLLGDPAKLKGDAALAAGKWKGPTAAAQPSELDGADVFVDALFGAGLDRPVEGDARWMIEAVNATCRAVSTVVRARSWASQ
jgi:ADP-dependent NAD(P)H-hydrate dehydratase / NAD(P)H-hydrate epimerase